jgi:hypothetical protein
MTEVKRMGGLHYGVILMWMLGGRRRRNCLCLTDCCGTEEAHKLRNKIRILSVY